MSTGSRGKRKNGRKRRAVSRNLYPNVDFYTGLIYRAIAVDEGMREDAAGRERFFRSMIERGSRGVGPVVGVRQIADHAVIGGDGGVLDESCEAVGQRQEEQQARMVVIDSWSARRIKACGAKISSRCSQASD